MEPQKTTFVFSPVALADLTPPPGIDSRVLEEHEFVIAQSVGISKTDYDNFLGDMHHYREFIEKNASLCRVDEAGVWHCLLVHPHNQTLGTLVMPDEDQYYPKWAAILPD